MEQEVEFSRGRASWAWAATAMVVALALFLSTAQTTINGSQSPYTTDVGEIQNALPRWGTIHWTAYPLYTLLGSTFVTLLRWVGVAPAAGASLFSTVWGVAAVGLVVALLRDLGVRGPLALLGALVAAVSTSIWMDSSLAEVHTLTIVLTVATLLFALRFGRDGRRRDLLLTAFFFSQGVAHQRAVLFLAPAVLVLAWGQWREIWRGLLPAAAVSLLAPLTYLYLPLRVRQGATWTFGTPGTFQQVMTMLFDNRAERIVSWPAGMVEWWDRIKLSFDVTASDLPLALLLLGLLGLLVPLLDKRRREAVGMTLAWIPYLFLTAVIWIGRVGDAQLAAHLPVTVLAAVGLALLAERAGGVSRWGRVVVVGLLGVTILTLTLVHRPLVLEVTRDPSAEEVVIIAEQVAPPPDDRPTTFMALWGHDYWALAYAQPYQGRLPGLDIVDHNADFAAVLHGGGRLLTFSRTFYERPLSWWEEQLGRIHLSSVAPRVVEIGLEPPVQVADLPPGPELDLGEGIWIRSAELTWRDAGELMLTVYWQADRAAPLDHSIAVHLVAYDPPRGPQDILDQADRANPVYGWYPFSRWEQDEVVRTHHLIQIPPGSQPFGVRVALYRVDDDGEFVNSPWLTLPLPDRPSTIDQ